MLAALLLPWISDASLRPPTSDACVVRAVFAQDRLWVLDDAGRLSSLGEDEEAPRPEIADPPLLDLTVHAGSPHAIESHLTPWPEWRVVRITGFGYEEIARVVPAGDELVGLASSSTGLVVVTSRRVVEIDREVTREIWLSQDLPACVDTATLLAQSKAVYVGVNVGEYGGGLFRIERETGTVAELETREIEDRYPDFSGDTITGVVPLPWEPDALAVSTAEYLGRVLRVRRAELGPLWVREPKEGSEINESPILGLAPADRSLWAITLEGIYRIDSEGRATSVPAPPTRNYGGLVASFDLPSLVIIVRSDYGRPEPWPFGSSSLLVSR